jgi:hypothetical protein
MADIPRNFLYGTAWKKDKTKQLVAMALRAGIFRPLSRFDMLFIISVVYKNTDTFHWHVGIYETLL